MDKITKVWSRILDLSDEDYAKLRYRAEQNLVMKGSDSHTMSMVRLEMIKIKEGENES